MKESIPVTAGALRLLYPQWIPGHHSPGGHIKLLTGVKLMGAGIEIAWHRDPNDVFAFDLVVPRGVETLEATFEYLSPLKDDQGRVNVTQQLVAVDWNDVVLYPAGVRTDGIRVQASARFPRDWTIATSLTPEGRADDAVRFAQVSLTELVDSPAWAGRNVRKLDLAPGSPVPVSFDALADSPGSLAAEDEHVSALRELVRQTYKVFGDPYFAHYDFLFATSKRFPDRLEHLASTEIRLDPEFFTRWKSIAASRYVITHEFVHSWIGKKHRPVDLATPNYNVPMGDSLLWVYEGETDFWTYVLTGRSDLLTHGEELDAIARTAAYVDSRARPRWRNLQDTTNDPVIRRARPRAILDELAARIRLLRRKRLSLDGGRRTPSHAHEQDEVDGRFRACLPWLPHGPGIMTYTEPDLANTLETLSPGDWSAFLREALDSKSHSPAEEALRAAGWRVVYTGPAGRFLDDIDSANKGADFSQSMGSAWAEDEIVNFVQWDGPAFRAGLAADGKLVAVNGREYKEEDLLKEAITAAKARASPSRSS